MITLLDPMLDVVFKIMFAHPDSMDLLCSLLNAVFRPPSPIVFVEVLNPILDKASVRNRGVVLDLRVKLRNGSQANIEMQPHKRAGFPGRILYHWARLFGFQLVPGDNYKDLHRCASVFLVGQDELPSRRFHSTFKVLESHDHEPLSDHLELHIVQLHRPPPMHSPEFAEQRELVDWSRFFVAKTPQEREEMSMNNPIIAKANGVLERLSADPDMQQLARENEEAFVLYRRELYLTREVALEEGEEKGIASGQRAMVLAMVQSRFTDVPDEVAALIGQASPAQLTRWAALPFSADSAEAWLRAILTSDGEP